jgi:dienelactone hydrolase
MSAALLLFAQGRTVGCAITSLCVMLIAVTRPVREDGVIGTLVEPAGEPRGAVLVLGGSTGGMDETIATALADAGFVSLALAYFGVTGLPDRLAEIPVETVERGVLWLRDHPGVGKLRVGLVGSSKGGELALLAASLFSEHLSAVVGFSASPVVWQAVPRDRRDRQLPARSSWTSAGAPVPFVRYGRPPVSTIMSLASAPLLHRPLNLLGLYERALKREPEAVAAATIPVEQIAAPILLISGTDDQLWPSTTLAELAMTRLAQSERPYHDMHLSYNGAGHLAGRPAGPPAGSQRYALGGTAANDLASHQDAWPQVLRQLAGDASMER